jgi:hypothetical protein
MSTTELCGAWSLEEWSMTGAPFGAEPTGSLIYDACGVFSAQVCGARSYLAYGGRWRVEGEVLMHDVRMSLDPTWVGTTQQRPFSLAGDQLSMAIAERAIGDVVGESRLTWRRVARRNVR